ncbi:MAG: SAM-dependent chlorinase/fluorinase [Chloroflexota bacterium]
MAAIITLTTDFGLADGYVAAMKGVIMGINPEATLVDISHDIAPQNIPQAAFVLGTACPSFPEKTVHLVVVDPGVGTERQALVLRTPSADFVAPDNGVLSYVIEPFSDGPLSGDSVDLTEMAAGLEAVAIAVPRFWRTPVSATFHGRDIFAPVAGWLSRGLSLDSFGPALTRVTVLPLPRPRRAADGSLVGQVRHVDRFGNLITSITTADLPPAGMPLAVEVAGRRITGLSRSYAGGGGLLAVIGSSGYLEVAFLEGSAADRLKAGVGDEVRLHNGQP